MIPYRNNKVLLVALGLFFVLILTYAYFEARNILFGPKIEVNSPKEGLTVDYEFVTITGRAININEIWMNGRSIPVTEDGIFEEGVLLTNGYNKIFIQAKDKLGRETTKIIQIVYIPKNSTNIESNRSSL
jgi:hypothetical protein